MLEPGDTSEDESDSDELPPVEAEESDDEEEGTRKRSRAEAEEEEEAEEEALRSYPIKRVCDIWPNTRIVHGRARHSESQGAIHRARESNGGVNNREMARGQQDQDVVWSSLPVAVTVDSEQPPQRDNACDTSIVCHRTQSAREDRDGAHWRHSSGGDAGRVC